MSDGIRGLIDSAYADRGTSRDAVRYAPRISEKIAERMAAVGRAMRDLGPQVARSRERWAALAQAFAPPADETPQERALRLRRESNTGPESGQFRHRGIR